MFFLISVESTLAEGQVIPNKITKRFFLVFLLSVGALLEQILMNFDLGYFNFFSS